MISSSLFGGTPKTKMWGMVNGDLCSIGRNRGLMGMIGCNDTDDNVPSRLTGKPYYTLLTYLFGDRPTK